MLVNVSIYTIEATELHDLPAALRELANTMETFLADYIIQSEIEEGGEFNFQQDGEVFNVDLNLQQDEEECDEEE